MKLLARKVVNWLYFGVWSACPHDWVPYLQASRAMRTPCQWSCRMCGAER